MGRNIKKQMKTKIGIGIVGEGITEYFYFSHLKSILGYKCTVRPRFFCKSSITEIGKRIRELLYGDICVICIFDADVSKRIKSEQKKLDELKDEYKNNKNVIFCDSMPSIEYWFLLHFKDTCPSITRSIDAERLLKKSIPTYEKTIKFLEKEKWVDDMTSGVKNNITLANERAIKYSKSNTSYSKIFLAIEKLNKTL